MIKRLLFLLFIAASSLSAQAQPNAHLTITGFVNFPDTALEGIPYPIEINIQNIGTAPFQGPLQIILETDTAYDVLFFSNNPNFVLFPNDTAVLSTTAGGAFGYVFTPAVFRPGNDVIVVWPYSTQMGVDYDSIYTAVYFVPINGIGEQARGSMKVYPNPFKDAIHFTLDGHKEAEQVRILDPSGRVLHHAQNDSTSLDLSFLMEGLYIMEISLKDGSVFFARVVKE